MIQWPKHVTQINYFFVISQQTSWGASWEHALDERVSQNVKHLIRSQKIKQF